MNKNKVYSERFEEYFKGYGAGKYNPATEKITLDILLGTPYFTKTILSHCEVLGKIADQTQDTINVSGPRSNIITSPDIKKRENTVYDLRLLIKRHLVLTHELVHRRLTMDTSYGFILRYYGLAKIYLDQNRESLDEHEIKYLEILQARYRSMMKSWTPLQEYVANYCTWVEINYLLAMVSSDKRLSKCECNISTFEENIGDLNTYTKQEIIQYLETFKEKIKKGNEYLESNPIVMNEQRYSKLPSLLKVELLKQDFLLLYLAFYLGAGDPYAGDDFALCELDHDFWVQRAQIIDFLCQHYLELVESREKHIFEMLPAILFSDDRELRKGIDQLLYRTDFFCRKEVKLNYYEKLIEAKNKLGFGFFDFAIESIDFWDKKRVLWPMPAGIDENGYLNEIKLVPAEDLTNALSFGLADKLDELSRESSNKESIKSPNHKNDRAFFNEYAIDLIYGALFSRKDYTVAYEQVEEVRGGFPVSGKIQYYFSDISSLGHDVGSILNMLYCKY